MDTMVYAPSHQDALTGKIQVFAMGDLVWVKLEGDNKFLVGHNMYGHLCKPPCMLFGTTSARCIMQCRAHMMCLPRHGMKHHVLLACAGQVS